MLTNPYFNGNKKFCASYFIFFRNILFQIIAIISTKYLIDDIFHLYEFSGQDYLWGSLILSSLIILYASASFYDNLIKHGIIAPLKQIDPSIRYKASEAISIKQIKASGLLNDKAQKIKSKIVFLNDNFVIGQVETYNINDDSEICDTEKKIFCCLNINSKHRLFGLLKGRVERNQEMLISDVDPYKFESFFKSKLIPPSFTPEIKVALLELFFNHYQIQKQLSKSKTSRSIGIDLHFKANSMNFVFNFPGSYFFEDFNFSYSYYQIISKHYTGMISSLNSLSKEFNN